MDKPLKVKRNGFVARLKRNLFTVAAIFAVVFAVGALPIVFLYFMNLAYAEPEQSDGKTVAFVDVNIVPMDGERVIEKQTVIVKDGRIKKIGSYWLTSIPSDALRIDCKGKYLIPGLSDMHVHLQYYDDETVDAMFRLFLANGVTTILNLYGTPRHLEFRDRVARGEMLGPTVYTSGPFISDASSPFPTVEEVEEAVVEQKRMGYDFIKIHGDFSREAYHKLFEVARREGIRVVGHAPRNLGVEPMLEERQDAVVHSEEYIYAYFFYKPDRGRMADEEEGKRYIAEQETRIPYLAQATAKAGTWLIPNLTAYKTIGLQVADVDEVLDRPEVKYVPEAITEDWVPSNNTYVKRFPKDRAWYFKAQYGLLEKTVKGFRDAGVKMMAGTDTPIPSVVPGFSLHDELRDLTAAGLTPYEALKTATANPAEFLRELDKTGTIAEGKRADLVLVSGDPLKDIVNASRIEGVMVRGRWLDKLKLERMLGK